MKKARFALLLLIVAVFALGVAGGCFNKPATPTYTITYSSENVEMGTVACVGNIASGSKVKSGTSITLTATENAGYIFIGWYEGSTQKSLDKTYSFNMPEKEVSLVAKFKANGFALTFSSENLEMGTVACSNATSGSIVDQSTLITLTATENEGYAFDGWYEGSEKKSADKAYTFEMPAKAVTLVAKFSVNSYALTYSSENEEKGAVACSENIVSGTNVQYKKSITLTATEKVGYSFDGWYEGSEKKSADKAYTFEMPAKAVTLVAKFSVNSYALTYSSENEEKGTVACSENIVSGTNVQYKKSITLTATENEGYAFDGWYEGNERKSADKAYTFEMPAKAVTLVAKFSEKTYALTYTTENAEYGSVNSENIVSGTNVKYKTQVTLSATAQEGYDFIGWFEPNGNQPVSTNAEYVFNMPNNAVTLQAKFAPQKRTVTFYDGTDIIGNEILVDYNTVVTSNVGYQTVQNYSKPNHTFLYWQLQSGEMFNLTTPIKKDINLYGKWEQNIVKYSVRFVDKDGKLIGDVQELAEGTLIRQTQPAPAVEGYDFDKWICYQGNTVSGTGVDLVVNQTAVTSDLTIQATYAIKHFTVSFFLDKDNQVADFTEQVEYNNTVAIPSTPTDKAIDGQTYMFDKWVDGSDTAFNFNGAITENVDLYATWKLKPAETFVIEFYSDTQANGGTKISSQVIAKGKDATAPANPSKEGYDFIGWDKEFTAITENLRVNATYKIKTFKVVFKDYDGNILKQEQTVNYGEGAIAPANPSRTGYEFDGWDKEFNSVKDNLTVTATYSVNTFKVEFKNDDASQPIYVYENVAYGSTISVPATPSKEGFSFEGWYVDTNYSAKFDFTQPITKSQSVYAKFEEIVLETFTVKFMDGMNVISEQQITKGLSAIAPSAPVKTGYSFKEWDKAFDNVTEELIITAVYEKIKYEVKFFNADGSQQIGQTALVEYGNTASAVVPVSALIPSVTGKTFIGWDKNVETYTITENTSFFARYVAITKTVEFYKDANTLYIDAVTVEQGSCVNMPSTPNKAGYVFRYWATRVVENASDIANNVAIFDFSTKINDNIKLYAVYEKLTDICVVEFLDEQGNACATAQEVAKGQLAIEPAPYNDGTSAIYVWCVLNGKEFSAFDFDTKIDSDLKLYAVLSSKLN